MVSRRVLFSHRCCLTSISPIFRNQLQGSMVMLTNWTFYCDAHLGRKWKRVSTNTLLSWWITVVFVDNKRLVFQQAPKYLGVRLDRMLTSSNTLKTWQESLHLESRSSVVLLVQPGEPLSKHYGSPCKPWYSPQLNSVPMYGAEAHSRRTLTSQSTSLYDPIWLCEADTCVSAPCLSRDIQCRRKAESNHPRFGSETRLAHAARHDKE